MCECVCEREKGRKRRKCCSSLICVCALPPLLYVREAEDHCESDLIRLVEGERERQGKEGERVSVCNPTPFQLPRAQEKRDGDSAHRREVKKREGWARSAFGVGGNTCRTQSGMGPTSAAARAAPGPAARQEETSSKKRRN